MSSKNFTVHEIQQWCQDQAALIAERGYFNAAACVEIKDNERFCITQVGYTSANYNGDCLVNTQYLHCLTNYCQESFNKKFIDVEDAKRRALQERLARLIDEIKNTRIDIDVNPLLGISKQLSSNAIENHAD